MKTVELNWFECDCEVRSKYCYEMHRSSANVPREDLYRFLEGLKR